MRTPLSGTKQPLSAATAWVFLIILLHAPNTVRSDHRFWYDSHPKYRRVLQETTNSHDVLLVPDEYIVVLRDDVVTTPVVPGAPQEEFVLKQSFHGALQGFSAKLSPYTLVNLLQDDRVVFIEPNVLHSLATFQYNAPWGLDRIDQEDLPLNDLYGYEYTGSGVDVYVVDSGVLRTHPDMIGRVSCALDVTNRKMGTCQDIYGHGTHVAGLIASTTFGVAKEAYVYAIKACSNTGLCPTDWLITALNHVAAQSGKRVANLSVAGSYTAAFEVATRGAAAAGVVVVLAGGNISLDACRTMARADETIVVGAVNATGAQAWFSNYGKCIDLWAPGVSIPSTANNGASELRSGTSMAAPHVAGAAALLLEQDVPSGSVLGTLKANSVRGQLTGLGPKSENLLLHIPTGLTVPPTVAPSGMPSVLPSMIPTIEPTVSALPSSEPSAFPSLQPSMTPSSSPSSQPSPQPTMNPSSLPSGLPSASPSLMPSELPSSTPSSIPSMTPSDAPSLVPSSPPTISLQPSLTPSEPPSTAPTTSCPADRIGRVCWLSWGCRCPGYRCRNRRLFWLMLGRCLPSSDAG